jgi:tryptophan-rich sensory protein
VWRSGREDRAPALRLYGAQLLLNTAWSLIFFGLRAPGLAVVEIALLWVAIAATVKAFRSRSRPAGLLMLPYLAWVTFAVALNVEIWRRNA